MKGEKPSERVTHSSKGESIKNWYKFYCKIVLPKKVLGCKGFGCIISLILYSIKNIIKASNFDEANQQSTFEL